MFVIIGLGNPGREFEGTRHNVGYRVTEALSKEISAGRPFRLYRSVCASAEYAGRRLLLVQPLTYMNLSGLAMLELSRRFRLTPENMLLIHDELDLPLGTIRFKSGGGSAGHKGIQSIIEELGSLDFLRLRFGIGRPPLAGEAAGYVLKPFPVTEQKLARETIDRAVEATMFLIKAGLEETMNRFN